VNRTWVRAIRWGIWPDADGGCPADLRGRLAAGRSLCLAGKSPTMLNAVVRTWVVGQDPLDQGAR
jgi:hypothetical protein